MATVHYPTNRGLLEIAEGRWNSAGAGDIRVGFIAGTSRPAGIDTLAEVADLNTVAELLAVTGVDEPTAAGYARFQLTRTNAAEDDANNRVDLDADNNTMNGVAAGDNIIGWFVFRQVTNDADSPLWSVGLLDAPGLPTNGSNILTTIDDVYRLTAA